MTYETSDLILSMGKTAALEKLMLDRNLPKPDMRTQCFLNLLILLEDEVRELHLELTKKSKNELYGIKLFQTNLKDIRSEAGDIIAFASGIVAKVNQELDNLKPQPSLFDNLNN